MSFKKHRKTKAMAEQIQHTLIDQLALDAYLYAMGLERAMRDSHQDELEEAARRVTNKFKATIRATLAAALAAPAGAAAELHAEIVKHCSGLSTLADDIRTLTRDLGAMQAEIAGQEATNLHLSAMVDELRELLQDAKRAMTELHEAAVPDESTEGVPAIIPPAAFRKFVDAHAMLCFCLHQRGHNPQQTQQTAPNFAVGGALPPGILRLLGESGPELELSKK